jgi:hypothetical protein
MNARHCAPVVLALLWALPAFPQGERGTITGTVTDTTGGIVTAATVTLRNVGTNIKTTATSNAGWALRLSRTHAGQL